MSMTVQSVFLTIFVTAAVGLVGALVTLRVARFSMRWTALLAPLTVLLAVTAGLFTGAAEMLIDQRVPLLMLLVTGPVALLSGVFLAVQTDRQQQRTQRELAQAEQLAAEERRAREVEAGRRELITWVSHDLRTPLAGIRAMAEALEDGIAANPSEYYRAIAAEAQRTTEMVADVMALAGLHTGAARVAAEPVSLSDIVSDLLAQLGSLAAQRQVTLVGESETTQEVVGDTKLLTRAVQNVIANALCYTAVGSEVRVRVALAAGVDQPAVEVSVSDACGGLAPEALARAFEVGWRADVARSPGVQAGTGLGLAITREIVGLHGGTVTLQNYGAGCRVVCLVPLVR